MFPLFCKRVTEFLSLKKYHTENNISYFQIIIETKKTLT